MALRLMEVIVPLEDLSRLFQFLEEKKVMGVCSSGVSEKNGIVRALMKTEQTEAISDFLSQNFGFRKDFRLMLFSVEATLPIPEETTAPKESQLPPADKKSADSLGRISRGELYQDVAQGSELTWTYVATVILSTVVAIFGLVRNDIAILIGAMVIAPLLGPNVALSLASTLGDKALAIRSTKTLVVGILTAGSLSLTIGLAMHVNPDVPAIASRTHVNIGDVLLALASGCAGAPWLSHPGFRLP